MLLKSFKTWDYALDIIGPIYPFIISPYFLSSTLCVASLVMGHRIKKHYQILQSQSSHTWSPEWPQMVDAIDDRG